jgi:hypothetical protein
MGMGYLELPQVEFGRGGVLRRELLREKGVFILDCGAELFLWVAKGANRSVINKMFYYIKINKFKKCQKIGTIIIYNFSAFYNR